MQANPFAILNKKEQLSHAYLCYGDFKECEESFGASLKETGVRLRSPGHYIFEKDTFGVDDARDLVAWYQTGRTSNDDTHTVAVIAAKVIKKDAQQMLLKILEEARHPYSFFIFASPGSEIIDTVLSRVQYIGTVSGKNKDIEKLFTLSTGEMISIVGLSIKNMESHEIRVYTEELVRTAIVRLHKENKFDKIKLFLNAQNALVESRIAPKFILDYILAII